MNRTALSVVALAVGAILILGLYNIYKPQTNHMVHDVFDKIPVTRMADNSSSTGNNNGGSASRNNTNSHADNPNDPNSPSNPQNIPDNHGVTPREWKKGVKVRALTTEMAEPANQAVDHTLGQNWFYLGHHAEPVFNSFNQHNIAGALDGAVSPFPDEYKYVPLKDFNINNSSTFTTHYDKANNVLSILNSNR